MAEKMAEPRELFLHELGDVLTAERTIVTMLPKLKQEARDKELVSGFEEHLKETRQHVENVEQAFRQLGERPKAEPCPGIDGLKTEHDKFVSEEEASPEILELFVAGAAARTEHYEIASYQGLVTMARALGEKEVVELLQRNLEQEKSMLKKTETISRRLTKEAAKQAKAAA